VSSHDVLETSALRMNARCESFTPLVNSESIMSWSRLH